MFCHSEEGASSSAKRSLPEAEMSEIAIRLSKTVIPDQVGNPVVEHGLNTGFPLSRE